MVNSKFIEMRDQSTKDRFILCDEKAKAYTIESDDRLNNFKVMAMITGRTMEDALQFALTKHYLSIMAYITHGTETSEGVESNIDDAQNYLDLLRAMVRERKNEQSPDNS